MYQGFQLMSCCLIIYCSFIAIIPYMWHVKLLLILMFRRLVLVGSPYGGNRLILECVGVLVRYVSASISLSLVMERLMMISVTLTFFSWCNTANESGETPLDIAKRLKHTHCEELVSVASFHIFVHL